ncbi:hypothetical protein HDU93_008631, partial [Gonapodya sp. JEL0774]
KYQSSVPDSMEDCNAGAPIELDLVLFMSSAFRLSVLELTTPHLPSHHPRTLCYHPRLPPRGSCRLCLVQVVGSWKLLPACVTTVAEGMEINTDTVEAKENVKGVLTMLRAEHPNECLNCESNGRCEFQDLIYRYDIPDAHPRGTKMAGHVHDRGHNPYGHTVIGLHPPEYYEQHFFDEDRPDVVHELAKPVQDHHARTVPNEPTRPQADKYDGRYFEFGYANPHKEEVDVSSDAVARSMDKCVKCGRCVTACSHLQDMNILGFTSRGDHAHVDTPFSAPLSMTLCIECGQCSAYCPVGAITARSEVDAVLRELESKRKVMVACTAPATRVAIGEEVYMGEGENEEGRMVAGLRHIGFDYVFDTNFSADLTIMEEGSELISRLNNGGTFPMLTSCCPGWVNLVEKSHPELIPNLSSARSPQAMLSSMVKHYFAKKLGKDPADVCVVSVMPCTAKKHEAGREEFSFTDARGRKVRETDHVITTRELGHIFRLLRVPLAQLKPSDYDPTLGVATGAGVIFGVTGGVMEAAVRTAQILTGVEKPIPLGALHDVRGLQGVKSATVAVKNAAGQEVPVRVAVAHGGKNVKELLKKMQAKEVEFDFVEIMMCPGGCIGGGGQPKSKSKDILQKRMAAVYDEDERKVLRRSHENPMIKELYENFLGAPLSETAHHYLHTHYHDRSHPHDETPETRGDGKLCRRLNSNQL